MVAVGVGALVIGGALWMIADCKKKCREFCPIPLPNDEIEEGERERQIFECQLNCAHAFGEALEALGLGDLTPTRIK